MLLCASPVVRGWKQTQVLGNIQVGRGALIAPGALVLKPVEPYMMVAGAPAEAVGMRPVSVRLLQRLIASAAVAPHRSVAPWQQPFFLASDPSVRSHNAPPVVPSFFSLFNTTLFAQASIRSMDPV